MSSIPLLLFLFLPQSLPQNFICSSVPQKKKKKKLLLIREKRETKTWRGERLGRIGLGLQPLLVVLPANRLGSDRLFLSFIFFLPYLLVLMIQLYFKNWILFCVLYFVFGLILFLMNRSLSFLFFLFFSFIFLISFGL